MSGVAAFWLGLGFVVGCFFFSLGIETGLTNLAKGIERAAARYRGGP